MTSRRPRTANRRTRVLASARGSVVETARASARASPWLSVICCVRGRGLPQYLISDECVAALPPPRRWRSPRAVTLLWQGADWGLPARRATARRRHGVGRRPPRPHASAGCRRWQRHKSHNSKVAERQKCDPAPSDFGSEEIVRAPRRGEERYGAAGVVPPSRSGIAGAARILPSIVARLPILIRIAAAAAAAGPHRSMP